MDDKQWQKWQSWITTIRVDVAQAINDRATFQAFTDILRNNSTWIQENHGDHFCRFVIRSYVANVTMSVRRQLKGGATEGDSRSMRSLLCAILKATPTLTWSLYETLVPDSPWRLSAFRFVSDDGIRASAEVIVGRIAELESIASKVIRYGDRVIAHVDRRGEHAAMTFNDLANALAQLEALVLDCDSFLGGNGRSTLQSVVQYPWQRIFDVPLKKPPQ